MDYQTKRNNILWDFACSNRIKKVISMFEDCDILQAVHETEQLHKLMTIRYEELFKNLELKEAQQ